MKKNTRLKNAKFAPRLKIVLICLACYLGLFGLLYSGITPEQYDIQVGAPAPTQIKATKDIQDIVTTEANRDRAANAVEPSYKSADPSVVDSVLADLTSQFDKLKSLRSRYTTETVASLTTMEMAEISKSVSLPLSKDQLTTLIDTADSIIDGIFSDATTAVREALLSTLPEGQESNAIKKIRDDLVQRYNLQLTNIVVDAVRNCLRPNMLIDEEITEANRAKAREDVQVVWYVKDQVIVGEGQIVTDAQYTMISALGILDENTFDVRLLIGIALLILPIMFSLGIYLYHFNRDILNSPKQLFLLCLILLLVVGLSWGFRIIHSYLMPVSLGLLLVALLIDQRLALFVNLMLALLVAVLAPAGSGTFSITLMTAISGPVIVLLLAHKSLRTTTLLAGGIIGAINFLVTLSVGLINSAALYDVLINAGVAAGSGIISAVLCIGIQPLLEWMFNLATYSKLIELSNPNQPLLRRLLLEASGTYHHSIIVANLAEAACTAVGANGLLARVGAYYHDIGKLKRPMYFKENQMGDNPHDRTDPRVSTAILTAHTRDGAQMAQKARIPQPVIDIIRQHHGDTPVMYFYDKAQKLYGDQVDISAFRYEGPRPTSREAAIVMLADTIEAATRALPNPDPEKIEALIRKLIRGKLNDGQLNNSSLTFNELDKICSAFSTVLTGVFHERIEYPDVTIPPRLARTGAPAEEKAPASPEAVHPVHPSEPIRPAEPHAVRPTPAQEPPKTAEPHTVRPAPAQEAVKPSENHTVSAGQPVPPVRPAPAQEAVKPSENHTVSAGQPVPPVRPTPAQEAVKTSENHTVSAGQPVPPVRPVPAQEAVKPSENHTISAGQPVPPVRPAPVQEAAKAVKPAAEDHLSKDVNSNGH